MVWYVLKRLGSAVLVVFVLSIVVFVMIRLIPGDPASAFVDPNNPDPDQIARIHHQLGLDRPWVVQYGSWIFDALRGDFGRSITQPYDVSEQIAGRLPVSVELGVLATIFGVILGIPAGVLSAVRRGKISDGALRFLSFAFLSIPGFILGTFVLLTNASMFKLPLLGFIPFQVDPVQNIQKMILPALTLGVSLAALVCRYTRGMLLDTFNQDFMRTGRAKGVKPWPLVRRHALRNGLIPVTTVVGVSLASLVGGTVITENVFALPGMGSLLITAINTTDYPTIQASILVIGILYVSINLVVDLLYPLIDPRVRVTA